MNNDIIKLLNIIDKDIEITKIDIKDETKYIHIQKISKPLCKNCNSKMYSKGINERKVNHPILQDGFKLYLIIKQRKWRCVNKDCNCYYNDEFSFLEKYKQSTSLTPFLILDALKDLNETVVSIAKKYNVSDTYVHYIFAKYIDMKPLKLSSVISIDEVYMDFNSKNLYSLIILDFITDQIIDILPNRKEETTNRYFLSIPLEERKNVKYLICDMYNPYINYINKYFPNAICIVDSFHVIQWITNSIRNYINKLKKKYKEQDELKLKNKNYKTNKNKNTIAQCDELYLLNNFSFFALGNRKNIVYKDERKYNRKFKMYLSIYQLENMFFNIDPNLKEMTNLKQLYIDFNNDFVENDIMIESRLNYLINLYKTSKFDIFREFAKLLIKHKKQILNSFTFVECEDENGVIFKRRLSNGPIESWNNKPKDYKRICNGVKNFEFTRNRLLWSTRRNPSILAIPKSEKEVHNTKYKKRGNYNK